MIALLGFVVLVFVGILSLAHTVVCVRDSIDVEDWITAGMSAAVTALCGLVAWAAWTGNLH